ncbi:MAG TPA: hypothetical protein PKD24_11470 [Pyrinomonadaceae bacterium]|nr:hypothetical protein [Pyrinomonadaceae bacterium]HMP66135.1 hypothetical protein [Pyrinomonadaceae bacterium]
MKKVIFLLLAVGIIKLCVALDAVSQFPIRLPSIPNPGQQSQRPSTPDRSEEKPAQPRTPEVNADSPSIVKDSIQIRARTLGGYNAKFWTWVPDIEFSVNGPIESGSQLYVEFNLPGSGLWLKFDCQTDPKAPGFSHKTECGGHRVPDDKGSTYAGTVSFSIKMRNELLGSDITLFNGKMKVGKVRSNEAGPNAANLFVYYVDHDWNLPIAYLFYEGDYQYEEGRPERWAKPKFNIAFWTRGDTSLNARPHLFFGGKEIGKAFYNGSEVSVPSCSTPEVRNGVSKGTVPEGQYVWQRWKCTFYNVIPWNRSSGSNETLFGRMYLFSENPGTYEMKIMADGRLIRTLKFDVDKEGRLVDNGIATVNKLGSDRMIVPVQVLGDQDGPWDRNAWKTDAFYGNPLTGFTEP